MIFKSIIEIKGYRLFLYYKISIEIQIMSWSADPVKYDIYANS